MKIGLLGSGAREHAIAMVLQQGGHDLWILPGNAGTVQCGTNERIDPENVDAVVSFALGQALDLVVVGPEGPLVKGVVDRLALAGIPAFGPTQAAAQVEASKSFALELMRRAHIPHPASWVFSNTQAVGTFVERYAKPVVVKADGLAGGKGVWVCNTMAEAVQAAALCSDLYPGPIVVQERLSGREVSVFVFTDGFSISKPVAACDYKRRDNDNKGPNTGGMGSYAWPEFWDEELEAEVLEWIIRPLIRLMAQLGFPFSGMLYAGLMLTEDGPRVLEFNCRPGDPESQVVFPLFVGDLARVMLSCARGTLSSDVVAWDRVLSTVGVVVASPHYPNEAPGYMVEVPGSLRNGDSCTWILHGTTEFATDGKRMLARGGRMFTIVGKGHSVLEARMRANARLEGIELSHHARTDIGTEA